MQKGFRTGKWIARRGSILKVIAEGDSFFGTYNTSHGRPTFEETFPCNGMLNEDLVGFTVPFHGYFSLTTWCGRVEDREGEECLRAVWHHARMFGDKSNTEPIADWCVFHVGQSEFFWGGELSEEEILEIRKVKSL